MMKKTNSKASIAYKHLRNLIDSDRYKIGDKLPTEAALSEELGINRQTISKAFAALKGEGLIERATKRGTILLRKPSDAQNKTLLIISPWPEWSVSGNWYFSTLLYSIYIEAIQAGISILNVAFHALRPDEKEIEKIRALYRSTHCIGLIVVDPFTATHRKLKELIDQLNGPAVWAGSGLNSYTESHRVDINNFETAKKLTEKLIANGAKKIIFMSGALNTSARQQRLEGYKNALEENGLPFDERMIICHNATHLDEAGSECAALYAARWLESDALFLNDSEMLGGIRKFCDHYPNPNLEQLKKMPIATFDYQESKKEGNIRYSAIQPIAEIGSQAVQLLLQVQKEPTSPPIVKTLSAQIIEF